ncbi:MAG TPA: hypothetical protein VLB67_02640 [Acidimicrobiia bacterium]|nr:hypothetical protein [Acidimicrobiia bacterium]
MTEPFDDLRRYADELASEVSPFTAERAVHRALSTPSRRPRRVVVAVITTGLLGISNVALATIADPAVPGDPLYGVDRAYERVVDLAGLGSPRVSERLQETGVLVERGNLGEALALVQETLGKILDSDDPEAEMEKLVTVAADSPAAVNELVLAELVATARAVGSSDLTGQDVAALARDLGRALSEERSQRPDDAGRPDRAGRPDDPGSQGQGNANPNAGGNQP